MTGEMHSITQKGLDSNGDSWPTHAAIARAVKGKLKPFDVYQGPYIVVGPDVRVGISPYQMAIQHLGAIRLWITDTDDFERPQVRIWREDTETTSKPFWYEDTRAACKAARKLLIEQED